MMDLRRPAQRALTFVEVVISMAVLLVVLGSSTIAVLEQTTRTRDELATFDLELRGLRLEKLLRTELQSLSPNSIVLSDPQALGQFTRMEYRVVRGYDGATSSAILSELRRLEFEFEPGEANANASADGDRYRDEGTLVLFRDTNGDGALDASERVVVAALVASAGEEYVAGRGLVGVPFQFSLPSGSATPLSTDMTLSVALTLLGPDPNDPAAIRLRDFGPRFALRN